MPQSADVLLERGAAGSDRILSYLVPDRMAQSVAAGSRVVVPLGGRHISGLVLSLGEPPPGLALRPIHELLDAAPIVSPRHAALAEWLAARFLCRRCDAWSLFLPPGVARTGARRIVPAAPWLEVERRLSRFILPPHEAARLHKALTGLKRGGRAAGPLKKELGPLYQQVEVMLGEGYLGWREPWQRKKPGERRVNLLCATGKRPARPTPKQAGVLAYLDARGGPVSRAEIMAACGVGASVLDRLVASGCLAVEAAIQRRVPLERASAVCGTAPDLLPAQAEAVAWVGGHLSGGGIMLLHGVTGSGKTEVYLRALSLAAAAGRTGLLLVPEIGLTPQTVERVTARFGERVAVLHSRLSVGERLDEWERIRKGEADVVVGPRSTLFAPLDRLGVIVLDEEHDQAYKQEDGVRYHAREAAIELGRLAGAVVILGSATPSLEAMHYCARGLGAYFSLPERPGGRPLPPVETVDLREEARTGKAGALSARLREALAETLAAGGQSILLLNRRGYATFVICRECGHALRCRHCDVALTYHRGQTVLLCHYCGAVLPVPETCPACQGRRIGFFGLGTERLCEEVASLFPKARVARMDQDATAHKGAHQEVYQKLRKGGIDILVGTQMVAKGLDLPGVTLVGVVSADASLNRPDFRAAERTFQLLTQVAGRAGRGEAPGRVILQTYNPGHYSIACAARHDYHSFYQKETEIRRAAGYPPYGELVRIGLAGPDEAATWRAAEALAGRLRAALGRPGAGAAAEILGPTAALVKRVENRFRFHLLIKAAGLQEIGGVLSEAVARAREERRGDRVSIVLDVNPNTVL
ncbi:MAG: primosomal protein N' [Patescibacteria group bacterium]